MKNEKIWIILFMTVLMLPSNLFFTVKLESGNEENRTLQGFPAISIENIENFPIQFEAYVDDNFPFRIQLVEWNSLFTYYCLNDSPSTNVICGKDGWLFLKQDQIDNYKRTNLLNDEEISWLIENMNHTQQYFDEKGIEFVVYIAPDKASIYSDKLPDYIVHKNNMSSTEQIIECLEKETDVKIIYPKEELIGARAKWPEYQFYYPQDTHWNELGAYIGTEKLFSELNIAIPDFSKLAIKANSDARHGLTNMIGITNLKGNGEGYTVCGYGDEHIQRVEMVPDDNNTRYYSDLVDGKKILIIRDSFVEAMERYIASEYKETYLPHRDLYYTPEMIESEHPDIVVVEIVERCNRFLTWYKFVP